MRYGELTFEEIRQLARTDCLAIVPAGCTEQQGPHLPVDSDTWLAEHLCVSAARRLARIHGIEAVVLPALPFGPTPEHRSFGAGFIDLPQALQEQVLLAILGSLAEQGFQRIVLWQGCGGHTLHQVAGEFNEAHSGRARAFVPEPPYPAIWTALGNPDNPGGHADAFTTSLALHLRPALVRNALISNPKSAPVDWEDPALDFSRYTRTGVIGDPTEATAGLGAILWEEVLAQVVERLRGIATTPIKVDS